MFSFRSQFFSKFLWAAALTLCPLSFAQTPTLKIGIVLPMSGGTATFGSETNSGIQMAIEEINAAGKIKIQAILEDDKSDVTDAANAAKKLINIDKVTLILGSVASSNTNAMAPIAQAAKTPLMTPASTNVNVTQKGEYVSRICFIDDFQGFAMAKFAVETLKATKAAIVRDSASDYSLGLATAFEAAFKKLGGKIVVDVSYAAKDQDFSSQLTKVRMAKPDVVFAPGYYAEIGNMIKQAKTLGIRAPFLGGDGWSSPDLYKLAGPAIVGHYFADHFSDEDTDRAVQGFVSKFKAKYKTAPGAMAALGYDAVYVAADAFSRIGFKNDRAAMMKAINGTQKYPGVTGMISLDANRNANKPLVILQTLKDRATFKQRVSP